MSKRALVTGAIIFVIACLFVAYARSSIPVSELLSNDSESYSAAAVHLAQSGFYSLDGVVPYMEREPGYSAFLSVIYFLFGAGNVTAIFVIQAAVLFLSAFLFSRTLVPVIGRRAATIFFFLLLLFPATYKIIFTAYRESVTLSLLLLLGAVWLRFHAKPDLPFALFSGFLLGCISLTYYSFVFLPLFLIPFFLWQKMPLRYVACLIIVPYLMVAGWGLRNMAHTGSFRVIDSFRTTIMWYARGEQAEQLHGFEPFRCLYAEYISRDWAGRSEACSVTGLYHRKWTTGLPEGKEAAIAEEGKDKIKAHFPNYLWNSVFETLELHLPFVGGGWSFRYHLLATLGSLIVYVGFLFGVLRKWPMALGLFLLILLYNTAVFSLTDATPRYLMPVIFCYALLAAIGYDRLLSRCKT